MKRIFIKIIEFYQRRISPLKKPTCRFYPTCSAYAKECLEKHGLFRALFLITKRLLRCNPFFKGGYDPVPENKQKSR
ncbi:MAG: membrane protein insertion efficiency factor YidD [Erysipelotrichales bacterium]|nr:membrane protein insertion efficiency factor YidD [Erysipelotrichales bacterium]